MKRYRLLLVLLSLDLVFILLHIFFRGTLGFFDLDREQNLSTAYSGAQLLLAALFTGGYAWILWKIHARRGARWLFTFASAGFFYLGIDEMMTLHERIGGVLNKLTGLTGYWGETFNWVIYYSPFMAAGLLVFVTLLRFLLRHHRPHGILAVFGIGVLVVSLVFEVSSGAFLGTGNYQILLMLEEGAELLGESLIVVALARSFSEKLSQTIIWRRS